MRGYWLCCAGLFLCGAAIVKGERGLHLMMPGIFLILASFSS